MLEIKISFYTDNPETRINGLLLELDKEDALLEWDVMSAAQYSKTITQMCSHVKLKGKNSLPSYYMLQTAKVLDVITSPENAILSDLSIDLCHNHGAMPCVLDLYANAFPLDIPYPAISRPCRPLVRYFNANGLKTSASCAASGRQDKHRFRIWFAPSVNESKIRDFMAAHAPCNAGFQAGGWFGSQFLFESGNKNASCLFYEAGCLEDAMADLTDWVMDNMSGLPGHGARPGIQPACATVRTLMDRYGGLS